MSARRPCGGAATLDDGTATIKYRPGVLARVGAADDPLYADIESACAEFDGCTRLSEMLLEEMVPELQEVCPQQ